MQIRAFKTKIFLENEDLIRKIAQSGKKIHLSIGGMEEKEMHRKAEEYKKEFRTVDELKELQDSLK